MEERVLDNIGWVCSYTPLEMISASGFRPVRLAPSPPFRIVKADAYFRSNLCPFVRALFELIIERKLPPLSGIVLTTSCDAMRRLADYLRLATDIDYLYLLDLPRASTAYAVSYFHSQLERFKRSLEERFKVTIDRERITGEIKAYNHRRGVLKKMFSMISAGDEPGISRFFPVLDHFFSGEELSPLSEEDFLTKVNPVRGKPPRLVISGSRIDQRELLLMMEELGAKIVALDLCGGERAFDFFVPEDSGDPLLALAEGYLSRPPCARMGDLGRRTESLKRILEKREGEGIIYHTLKFCDTQGYDLPLISSELGLPLLHLETDGSGGFTGQLRTRVQAFIELLSG
jgi:benzoyl-CoA reductase/2-hydroxyglutaryl-CoA dehydratase subunit BcrC/BadD/HgdB